MMGEVRRGGSICVYKGLLNFEKFGTFVVMELLCTTIES